MTSLHREASDWLRYAADVYRQEYFLQRSIEREDILSAFMVLDFI